MTVGQERFLKGYLLVMVVLAWGAVLTGAYVVYPWYRAGCRWSAGGDRGFVGVSAAAVDA